MTNAEWASREFYTVYSAVYELRPKTQESILHLLWHVRVAPTTHTGGRGAPRARPRAEKGVYRTGARWP